mmetsp:Transcript_46582/g.97886  ORF Transcript_46582/g.97886 Transcript_46582/m.97886 type:complete len:581 (+) Transcript_46582:163-1905(+)|eukprot:CAMPEP_0183738190 /NCGR_PEP_ID=MMETSP0737-20130205/53979_1 /TAXON_ID=385413 /ORGANISM="Thalassiosira miniscula, Strain CCMP1093" /LENGTH=580 /DNA_ID=CAMNT_0025972675 /DNA_START=84 /DNA_END=1826 /DNA_ORIENTATION=+
MAAEETKISAADEDDAKPTAEAVVKTEEEKSSQDASSSSSLPPMTPSASAGEGSKTESSTTTFGRIVMIVQIVIALVVGAILGAYLTAYILETEYKSIVSALQSDHHTSLLASKNDYIKCQNNLTHEVTTAEVEMAKLVLHADQNERTFQQRAVEYVKETNAAYRHANEGLTKAQLRYQKEIMEHKATKNTVKEMESKLSKEVENHESTQLQLSQVDRRISAIRNTLAESQKELRAEQAAHNASISRERELGESLDEMEEELDRRDLERAECDDHHREMLQCRQSLREALEGNAGTAAAAAGIVEDENVLSVALANEKQASENLAAKLALALKEKEELEHTIGVLREEGVGHLMEMERISRELEEDRELWQMKAKNIMNKISFRNRKEVLERYGPGPYHVKFTLEFHTAPTTETILLALAPLDMMPHTIHTFLQIIEKNIYIGGTFILMREHILVGGPVDSHDLNSNRALEERMVNEGYFPEGALLYTEYTPEYPHVENTLGFNVHGGPIFYFNLKDNTEPHGARYSEEEGENEGDPCFAKIVEGVEVIQRMKDMPRAEGGGLQDPVYIVKAEVVTMAEE